MFTCIAFHGMMWRCSALRCPAPPCRVRMVRVRNPDSASSAKMLPKATAKLFSSKVRG